MSNRPSHSLCSILPATSFSTRTLLCPSSKCLHPSQAVSHCGHIQHAKMLHTSAPELLEQISWLTPHLPPPSTFRIRCEADYYGASHEIARAVGLDTPPHSSGTWRHGWSRFPSLLPEMVATYKPGTRVHLMPDEHHEKLLLDAGYPNALAVGYPLLYTASMAPVRRPRTLLAAPFHLLPEITPSESQLQFEHAFADYLTSQRAHFDTICVCLHISCVEAGVWTRTLESQGIPWVLGAMTNDANSLRRIRLLFESFECVVTNYIGSVMPYAAYLGARTCIADLGTPLPSPEAFAQHPTYQKHPEALERIKQSQSIPLSTDFPFLLTDPTAATCPKAWADEAVGAPFFVQHDSIARLLGWRSPGSQNPATRRHHLITLGSTPPTLADPNDREKIGAILTSFPIPISESVNSVLKDNKRLQKENRRLIDQSSMAQKWIPVGQSWTWRILGKPLFAIERLLRPSIRPRPTSIPLPTEEITKSD
jgi:hypothetical protein